MLKQIKESKVVDWIGSHRDAFIHGALAVGLTGITWLLSAKLEEVRANKAMQYLYDKGYLRFMKPSDDGEFIETTAKELSAWLTNNE